ncbi:MORN repeat-containing protein 4 [Trichoplax sp. H2]|nr:MORN repeat-containing protein 4 [Trichoplax sp. H2]|eukprot:RDD45626.1 MORN repeat-containing protein 4 [Trichoplax sp. H2]
MIDPCNLQLRRLVYQDNDGKRSTYIGQVDIAKGEKNGIGKQEMANRYIYIGHWLNGLFHGHGKLYSPELEICYTGEFEQGRMHGYGVLVRYSKPNDALQKESKRVIDKFAGKFTQGKPGRTGRRTIYHSKYNIESHEGTFVNNQLLYQCKPERVELAIERAEENQRIAEAVLSYYASLDLGRLPTTYKRCE